MQTMMGRPVSACAFLFIATLLSLSRGTTLGIASAAEVDIDALGGQHLGGDGAAAADGRAGTSAYYSGGGGGTKGATTPPRRTKQPREVRATFVNDLPNRSVNVYWAGTVGRPTERSLQMYYGPIRPGGGSRTIDAYEGMVFAITEVGGYGRLGEYVLGSSSLLDDEVDGEGDGGAPLDETHRLTEESLGEYLARFPPGDFVSGGDGGGDLSEESASAKREKLAAKCRRVNDAEDRPSSPERSAFRRRCEACVEVEGCGFSPVRHRASADGTGGCYASHSVVTVNSLDECEELSQIAEDASSERKSSQAWLNLATELIRRSGRGEGVEGTKSADGGGGSDTSSRVLRMAYMCLLRAADAHATKGGDKSDEMLQRRILATTYEVASKLEAVFDDADMQGLLDSSRHPRLDGVHPGMPSVPRRSFEDGIEYVLRGMPVVITDMFEAANNAGGSDPVASRWTLEYLNREVFGGGTAQASGDTAKFNVAADVGARCCQYFEPRGKAERLGYPYPFAPTTHLYRDTFDGFVRTVRKANRNAVVLDRDPALVGDDAGGNNSTIPMTRPRVLHYLHEIVMNSEGRATVAGGAAPPELEADLKAATDRLTPLATKQPFFGGFSNAKVWIGQRGIVMPLHYDATDNLYVPAYGRKRAIIGEPGQLDKLYRYPNQHPLVGSSQVNLTEADLDRYPNFYVAKLREVVVGVGDVLYLPAWWWHQFEQPFEDTAALNLWSVDRKDAPDAHMRDAAVRDHVLADELEGAIVHMYGKDAGIVLDALANGETSVYHAEMDKGKLKEAKVAMLRAAESWLDDVSQLPGGHRRMKESPYVLVDEYLDRTYRNVFRESPEGWRPGDGWDPSKVTKLPRELRNRCENAPESSQFMSICG